MKGIKDKAFELFPEMHTDSDDWDIIEEQCDRDKQRKAFAKGANYVIEEIEKVVQGDLDSHSAFKLKTIKQIVELLKK